MGNLKKNIKSTKLGEIEIEVRMYADECTRLRHMLEETLRAKNPLGDPEELAALQDQFRALSMDNKKIAKANRELGQILHIKEQTLAEALGKVEHLEKQLRKKETAKN